MRIPATRSDSASGVAPSTASDLSPASNIETEPDAAHHLRALLGALPHGAAIFDADLRCTHLNQNFARLGSHDTTAPDRTLAEILPQAAARLEPLMRQCIAQGRAITDAAIDVPGPDGELHWRFSATPSNDRAGSIVVQIREADTNAHAAEARSRRVLDNLFTFVGLMTPDGTLIDANRAPLEAGGLSIDDVRDRKIWNTYWFCHDPFLQARLQLSVEAAARGEVSRYDAVVRMKGDSRMSLDFMLAPLRDDAGVITHLVPSAIDITARAVSEEALRQSEERFRCVVEAAPDGLAMVDRNGCLALVNSGMERLFGYRREELLGQPIEMLIPERYRQGHAGHRKAYMKAPTTRDMAGRRELHALRKDGSEFPAEIGLNALNIVDGEHVLAAIVDVTTRKADQAILEKALGEKTVLLNEVHHRVKNNLQVVCSLLSLQSRTAPADARVMLEDSQKRVKAMALIHQLLYERSDFSSVDLGLYLRRLASLLRESLGEARSRVSIEVDAPSAIIMDLQRSVPCGLLINELVTNAIKHAFPDGRGGEIRVSTELLDASHARIIVADNGIGVPLHVTPGGVSSSLGFQLIPLFVDQLGGELRLVREAGSRFELHFRPGMERD